MKPVCVRNSIQTLPSSNSTTAGSMAPDSSTMPPLSTYTLVVVNGATRLPSRRNQSDEAHTSRSIWVATVRALAAAAYPRDHDAPARNERTIRSRPMNRPNPEAYRCFV